MRKTSMNRTPAVAAGLALAVLAVASPAPAQTYYQARPNHPGTYRGTWIYYPNAGGYYPGQGTTWYYDFYGQTPPNRASRSYPEQPGEPAASQMQQVQGEVLRTKRVETQTNTYLAALVETDDGRRVVVDLGPTRDLRDENVAVGKGDAVRARGWYTTVGEHRVFMADELRSDGRWVAINRRGQPSMERVREEDELRTRGPRPGGEEPSGEGYARGARGYRTEQFNGQIVRTSEVKVPELPDRLLFAQIRTDQGRKVLAMLGPVPELHDLELKKGEQVSVKGACLHMDGQPVVLTQQLTAQGRTFQADQQAHEEMLRRSAEVKGKVVRTKDIDLPGLDKEVLVAVVQGDDGQKYVVGLGTSQEMHNMEINKGDQITLRGPTFQMEGQRILLARQLTAHGQTVQLGEPEGRQGE